VKDLRGNWQMSERQISVGNTALRGSLEVFDLAHPAGQWVPSGENLGHHPSLMNAGEGCRAVASRSDAVAGLVPSLNELRLGHHAFCSAEFPLDSHEHRGLQALTATHIAETAIGVVRIRRFGAFWVPACRHRRCLHLGMPQDKRLVYVLKSATLKARYYIGLTSDVPARLADHNAGRCPHTARYRPWQLHVTIELPDEQRAVDFERYLKSGSGRAFAKRHFG
jgi:putative endonuclease